MSVHFDKISLVIEDKDEDSASVRVVFDPPMPEGITEEEFEENVQPCTVLAFMLLRELEKSYKQEIEMTLAGPQTLQ